MTALLTHKLNTMIARDAAERNARVAHHKPAAAKAEAARKQTLARKISERLKGTQQQ